MRLPAQEQARPGIAITNCAANVHNGHYIDKSGLMQEDFADFWAIFFPRPCLDQPKGKVLFDKSPFLPDIWGCQPCSLCRQSDRMSDVLELCLFEWRSSMNCPKCKEQLTGAVGGDVQVDQCAKCKGIWFDKDELRRAKDQVDGDLNWMDFDLWKHHDKFSVSAKAVKCPKCDVDMAAISYGKTGVEIDYCLKCQGVWLDGGEFERIIDALTEELLTKSVSDYVKASVAEAKEIVTGSEGLVSEWKDFATVVRMLQYRVLSGNQHLHNALVEFGKSSPFT